MCGRYRMTRADKLAQQFDVEIDGEVLDRYNVAPSQDALVIRQKKEEPKRVASPMRWGMIPFWAKDPGIGFKMINARAETLVQKPAYRDALKQRRCLVPADGFYEWKKAGKAKVPFCFTMADDSLFAFAGLWDRWRNGQGAVLESFSIITTGPNALVQDVHDRMPVILKPEHYDLWLDPGFQQTDDLSDMLAPFPPELMRKFEVSTRVNSVLNDDPACSDPVQRSLAIQGSL